MYDGSLVKHAEGRGNLHCPFERKRLQITVALIIAIVVCRFEAIPRLNVLFERSVLRILCDCIIKISILEPGSQLKDKGMLKLFSHVDFPHEAFIASLFTVLFHYVEKLCFIVIDLIQGSV